MWQFIKRLFTRADCDNVKQEVIVESKEEVKKFYSAKERELVACHEAGHAIVCRIAGKNYVVQQITIKPTKDYKGIVRARNVNGFFTKSDCLAELQWKFGGMVAEQLMYGEHSTGAEKDIKDVKEYLFYMLEAVGMGTKFVYPSDMEISIEAENILQNAKKECENILKENMQVLEHLQQELLKRETIEEYELEIFFQMNGI